jgi:hypothetical protein
VAAESEVVIAVSNICCSADGTIAAAIIIFFVEVLPLSLDRSTYHCIAGLGTAVMPAADFKDAIAIGYSLAIAIAIATGHKMMAISFIIFKVSSLTQPFSILVLNCFSKA